MGVIPNLQMIPVLFIRRLRDRQNSMIGRLVLSVNKLSRDNRDQIDTRSNSRTSVYTTHKRTRPTLREAYLRGETKSQEVPPTHTAAVRLITE